MTADRTLPARAAAVLAALLVSPPAAAGTATLVAARDNTLIESADGSVSNGAGPVFFAGRISSPQDSRRRAVLAFDLAAAIPPGAEITSVRLVLQMSQTNAGPVPVALHRLLADWGEGASSASGGSGAPAQPGDATWLHTFHDTAFWGQPGGDLDPLASGATMVDGPGVYAWGPTPEMVADAQAWLDDPASNFGWILVGDESAPTTVKRFDSREGADAAALPVLEVDYELPCPPDPAGPGYWHRQCLGLNPGDGGLDPGGRGRGPRHPTEPEFAASVLPCAGERLADLGLDAESACVTVAAGSPDPCARARRGVASLVFNLCAGRLQESCPVNPAGGDCSADDLGSLLDEAAALIAAGECRAAARCAAAPRE